MHICSIPVANSMYEVHLVRGRLFFNGREHLSVTDHDDGRIYISDEVPADDRQRVTAIAVAWAWRHLTRGLPTLPVAYDVNRDEPRYQSGP